MFQHFTKILLIYLISLTAALAVFFYNQNQPANLDRQILNAYQNFIWFNPSESTNSILGRQKIKQITIADLEPLNLSLLIKLENPEYLSRIEKNIKTAASQKIALKFPQTEEIILPDKTILRQKVARPTDFIWQEKKIKPGIASTWSQMTIRFLQKENNYFGCLIIDLIDSQNKTPIQILAFSMNENILTNLAVNDLAAKLKNYQNILYADSNFLNLIQDKLDSDMFFAEIEKILIQEEGGKFQIETKVY